MTGKVRTGVGHAPTGREIEHAARSMSRTERVAYLNAHGWTRVGSVGAGSWRDPAETGSWTVGAAIRTALASPDAACPVCGQTGTYDTRTDRFRHSRRACGSTS